MRSLLKNICGYVGKSYMSSKRNASALSKPSKKLRRFGSKQPRMGKNTVTPVIQGGAEGMATQPSGEHATPAECQILTSPTKSPFDKKEYRTIRLGNGLRVLLVSEMHKITEGGDEDDQQLYEDDPDEDMEEEESEEEEEGEEEESEEEEDEQMEEENEVEKASKSYMEGPNKYQAAAALCVGVGSFEDPKEIQGLMHFLEHMVFMGSEKYPKENSFDNFIKKRGGGDNAHTDMEHTTFYFEVQEKYLHEGLDRFAQFFIKPLMKKEAMQREREAVHSEFQMAQPEDAYRIQQLFASIADENHPMSKFTWGNETTLNLEIPDQELHEKLHKLRLQYYSAQYMTLAVQARLPLDTLQSWVTQIFESVPNNGIPKPTYGHISFPFPKEKMHKLYKIVPMKDYHSIEINWTLPTLLKHYRIKPLQYISHLLGHEGHGSILSFLKKKVWAVGLYAGNDESGFEHNSTYAVMSLSVELTNEGFKNIQEVLLVIFQYLKMIREAKPNERIYREIQQVEKIDFDYAEESKAVENVESLVENMQIYPPEDYLTGSDLLFEYNEQIIQNCLDHLIPSQCNIMISSKSYENICTQSETWFGTKYNMEAIPVAWELEWNNPPPNPDLFLPCPNTFIPDKYDLLSSESTILDYPKKIEESKWGELWFKQDEKFKLPRAYCNLYLLTDMVLKSPRLAAMLDLFLNLYQQQMVEDVYPATMAQYSYSVTATERGLVIKINGFNQKLPKLLELLLDNMENFGKQLEEKTFNEIKQQQMKSYYNGILKPNTTRKDIRLSVLQNVHWTLFSKLKALKDITPSSLLEEFVSNLIPSCHVRMLVQGNISESQTKEMYNMIRSKKESSSPSTMCVYPEIQTHCLVVGRNVVRVTGVNRNDTNSSVINYYQSGPGNLWEEVLNEFVMMVMDEPLFDFLRTKEQLGYHVYGTVRNTFSILGLSVTVNTQANKFSVSHVDERIEAFLKEFVMHLRNLKQEELEALRETLKSMKQTVDLTLKEEVDRNWAEISCGEYIFDRLKREIDLIPQITTEAASSYLEKLVCQENNNNYKKLSVQVVGGQSSEDGEVITLEDTLKQSEILKCIGASDDKDPNDTNFILDLESHKEKLVLYPVSRIVK
ncbi:unnamed protein product, partial [Meganyctiphanes norvegica]